MSRRKQKAKQKAATKPGKPLSQAEKWARFAAQRKADNMRRKIFSRGGGGFLGEQNAFDRTAEHPQGLLPSVGETTVVAPVRYLPTHYRSRSAFLSRHPTKVLRFSREAFRKLEYLRDVGDTEIAGFGVTNPEDSMHVMHFLMIEQENSVAYVEFKDNAVNDYMERMFDAGWQPRDCLRVWIHTHPGSSANPSGQDETTFQDCFGSADHAVMFILARGGEIYCRIREGTVSNLLPVRIDYEVADNPEWMTEYARCFDPAVSRHHQPFGQTHGWNDSDLGDWRNASDWRGIGSRDLGGKTEDGTQSKEGSWLSIYERERDRSVSPASEPSSLTVITDSEQGASGVRLILTDDDGRELFNDSVEQYLRQQEAVSDPVDQRSLSERIFTAIGTETDQHALNKMELIKQATPLLTPYGYDRADLLSMDLQEIDLLLSELRDAAEHQLLGPTALAADVTSAMNPADEDWKEHDALVKARGSHKQPLIAAASDLE